MVLGDAGAALSPGGPGSHLPPQPTGQPRGPLSASGAGLGQLYTTANKGPSPDVRIGSVAGGLQGRRTARVRSRSLRWEPPPIAAGSAWPEAGAGRLSTFPRAESFKLALQVSWADLASSELTHGALIPRGSGLTVFRDGGAVLKMR